MKETFNEATTPYLNFPFNAEAVEKRITQIGLLFVSYEAPTSEEGFSRSFNYATEPADVGGIYYSLLIRGANPQNDTSIESTSTGGSEKLGYTFLRSNPHDYGPLKLKFFDWSRWRKSLFDKKSSGLAILLVRER